MNLLTAGAGPCQACAAEKTAAAGSGEPCVCRPEFEGADGRCRRLCAPGQEPDDAFGCRPCAGGAYKPANGTAACLPCPDPTNASAPGAVALTECSCRAGEMGLREDMFGVAGARLVGPANRTAPPGV